MSRQKFPVTVIPFALVALVACAPATPTPAPTVTPAPSLTATLVPTATAFPTAAITPNPAPARTPEPTATATPVLERKVATNTLGYTSFNTATLSIDSSPLAAGINVKPTLANDGKYITYEGLVQATWTNDKKEPVTGFVDAKAIGITEGELKSAKTLTNKDNPLGFAPLPAGGLSQEEIDDWVLTEKIPTITTQ